MPTHTLTVERVPLDTLAPHPDNPRNGDTDAIAESLEVNGQYKPIVIAKDSTVLAGNHTYAAALEIGWTEIDAVRLDLLPDSQEAYRIMLADNRTSDLGRYDSGLLASLLSTFDTDLAGTGYDQRAVERIIAGVTDPSSLVDDLALPSGDPEMVYPDTERDRLLPWAFTPEQRAAVLAAVKSRQAGTDLDQPSALAALCQEFVNDDQGA